MNHYAATSTHKSDRQGEAYNFPLGIVSDSMYSNVLHARGEINGQKHKKKEN